MKTLPPDIPFERWVEHVFDHPVLEPQWWWQDEESEFYEHWDEDADLSRTLSFLTRLFLAPAFLIPQFTRAQIDQGLNYLVSTSCSNHSLVLIDKNLPWEGRRDCILSISRLYSELMAPVYGNDLGHLEQHNDPERWTFSCYMLWEVIPLHGAICHPDRDRMNDAVLKVFEETLTLKTEACLESVLHGLSHYHLYLPGRTEPIVRKFLAARDDVSAALRRYAELAAVGSVL